MDCPSRAVPPPPRRPAGRPLLYALAVALACSTVGGCAAFSNPVAEGVPARRLAPEYLAFPKDEMRTIPLTLLRRPQPDVYRLDAGDILGVYIEGVLGDKNQPVPVVLPGKVGETPALGYPLPVREDGTLPLPLIAPLQVRGKTLPEAQELVVKAYTVDTKILQPGRERILVTLLRERQVEVLVVRQDSATTIIGAGGAGGTILGNTRRGTGQVVELPAYESDVLNALTRTGGLPGLDALNEVIIERGNAAANLGGAFPPNVTAPRTRGSGSQVVRIPLRLREGEAPPFTPDDIILAKGDIVFIEARDTQVFYTGGLMTPRQFILPRDYDLTVVEAVALAGGPLVNNIIQNNLSGNITSTGFGSPSPSRATVLRRTRNRGQIAIQIDLNRALNDRRENILIQAGDVIILQETPAEAFTRYFVSVFRLNFLGTFIRQNDLIGTGTLNVP